jgi:hypothetical protein
MGWKKWPCWLKGGLIGFCIGVICLFSEFIWQFTAPSYWFYDSLMYLFRLPIMLIGKIVYLILGDDVAGEAYSALSFLLSPFVFAIGGLIIGLAYGKLKSKF